MTYVYWPIAAIVGTAAVLASGCQSALDCRRSDAQIVRTIDREAPVGTDYAAAKATLERLGARMSTQNYEMKVVKGETLFVLVPATRSEMTAMLPSPDMNKTSLLPSGASVLLTFDAAGRRLPGVRIDRWRSSLGGHQAGQEIPEVIKYRIVSESELKELENAE